MRTRYTRQLARDARTGRFISFDEARRRPETTVVETITVRGARRSPDYVTEENQNGFCSPWSK